jgi:hypothetical protein
VAFTLYFLSEGGADPISALAGVYPIGGEGSGTTSTFAQRYTGTYSDAQGEQTFTVSVLTRASCASQTSLTAVLLCSFSGVTQTPLSAYSVPASSNCQTYSTISNGLTDLVAAATATGSSSASSASATMSAGASSGVAAVASASAKITSKVSAAGQAASSGAAAASSAATSKAGSAGQREMAAGAPLLGAAFAIGAGLLGAGALFL